MSCKDCIYFRPEQLPDSFTGKVWEAKAIIPHYATDCEYKAADGYGLCAGHGDKRPYGGAVALKDPMKEGLQLCCHEDARNKNCHSFTAKEEQAEMFN